MESFELGHLLTDVVANAELALRRNHLVVFLIAQMLIAKWVIAHDLTALSLVFLDLVETDDLRTKAALNPKAMDYLLDHAAGSSDLDVLVAHRAVFVKNEPVLDAKLAKKLVAVVTLFRLTAHLFKRWSIFSGHLLKQIWQSKKSVKLLSISKIAILSVSYPASLASDGI